MSWTHGGLYPTLARVSELYDMVESGLLWGAVILILGLMAYLAFLQVETIKRRVRRRRARRLRRAAAAQGGGSNPAQADIHAKDR